MGVGTVLIILGVLPGPPGPGAIPIGLTMLTMDHPPSRRWRRVMLVWVGRKWQRRTRHTPSEAR